MSARPRPDEAIARAGNVTEPEEIMKRLLLLAGAMFIGAVVPAGAQDATMSFFVTSAGPWVNAKGEKIADDVASLHSDANNLTKQTALSEKGEVINGRGDTPNQHDILTGSNPDGTKVADQTCGDWTMGGAEGAAMLGHSDRTGLDDSAAAKSWNSSHASRGGCSQEALKGTGGAGLFYCFATN